MQSLQNWLMRAARAILAAMAVLLLGLSAAHADFWQDVQKRGSLRCAAPIYPPLIIKDPKTNQYSGVYLDMCREFAEKVLGVQVEFVDTTWDNVVAGLQSGKWDVSPALNRKPERALAINYSDSASFSELDVVFDPNNPKMKDVTSALDTLDQAGITIGLVSGTAQDHSVSRRMKNAKIVRLPSIDEVRMALMSRRVDATIDEVDTNRIFLLQYPERYISVKPAPALQKQGMGFGLPLKASWSDMQVLNIYIEEKVALGEVDDLFRFYSQKIIADSQQ